MKTEYFVDGIKIEQKRNRTYATIELESYESDRLIKLINMLTKLKNAGFETYETKYNIGYYDSVEEIGLTFSADTDKINFELLKQQTERI